MIKILHVFALLDRGGAETFAMNLLRHCPKNMQLDFLVHTDKHMDYEDEVLSYNAEIFRLPKYKVYNHFQYKKQLNALLAEHKYDVVHFHLRSTASLMIPIFQKYGVKVIVHSHSSSNGSSIMHNLSKTLLQFPLRYQADLKVGCTAESVYWLFGKRVFENKQYKLLPNAVDIEKFQAANDGTDLEFLNDRFVIGHIGRFEVVKNHQFIITMFSEYLKQQPNAILLLVGDGVLKQQIESLAVQLGVQENVIFLGKRTDIPYVLNKINILLFPSLYEGLPVTLVEAQASNTPILMSDTISKESILSPLAVQLSLNEPIETWINQVEEVSKLQLTALESERLINSSFNIKQLSNHYAEIISELLETKEDVR